MTREIQGYRTQGGKRPQGTPLSIIRCKIARSAASFVTNCPFSSNTYAVEDRRLLARLAADGKSAVKMATLFASIAAYLASAERATVTELTNARAIAFGPADLPTSRGGVLRSCAELSASTCRRVNASDDD
ncbi:MAG TPA: hypothetical protein VIK18_22720 [Pirellulales bacterium]